MKRLGFKELLKEGDAGYIITSFHFPEHERFDFPKLYSELSDKGECKWEERKQREKREGEGKEWREREKKKKEAYLKSRIKREKN